jgi:hypothetical protein
LFCLFAQSLYLFLGGFRSRDVKAKVNALKANGHVGGYTECAAKIEIAFDRDFNAIGHNSHGCGDHLTRDLCACRQGSEEKISGTSGGAGTSDAGVSLRLVQGTSDGN